MEFSIEELRKVAEIRGKYLLVVEIRDEIHGFFIPSSKCTIQDITNSLSDNDWEIIGSDEYFIDTEEKDLPESENVIIDWSLHDVYYITICPEASKKFDDEDLDKEIHQALETTAEESAKHAYGSGPIQQDEDEETDWDTDWDRPRAY